MLSAETLILASSRDVASFVMAASMALACAVLSVFVVARRWAFIGEGIAHSGFGGAGTVWILMLLFPSLAAEGHEYLPYLGVVCFSVATAIGIGYFTRNGTTNSDAVIGIFLVASLAWGILAQFIYRHARHVDPVGWDTFLFGQMSVTPRFAGIAVLLCLAVVAILFALGREIIAYCFDPTTAEASGVRVGFIHYLLMILVSVTIVIGVRLAGNVLVTALLVLPGATALIRCRSLRATMLASLAVAMIGTIGGLLINHHWTFIPTGPAIVLLMFAQFILVYLASRMSKS